jgi:hypothetical protein
MPPRGAGRAGALRAVAPSPRVIGLLDRLNAADEQAVIQGLVDLAHSFGRVSASLHANRSLRPDVLHLHITSAYHRALTAGEDWGRRERRCGLDGRGVLHDLATMRRAVGAVRDAETSRLAESDRAGAARDRGSWTDLWQPNRIVPAGPLGSA